LLKGAPAVNSKTNGRDGTGINNVFVLIEMKDIRLAMHAM